MMSKINFSVDKEKEILLKNLLGKAVEILPGMSEEYLLFGLEDNRKIYLRGESEIPCAYIEVGIFGNENHSGYKEFSLEVTKIFNAVLNISTKNIYIKFYDIESWSVGGMYFDRKNYQRL